MRQINLRLSEEEYEALREYCFQRNMKMTTFFKDALSKIRPAEKKGDSKNLIMDEDDIASLFN
jgi:hypothetical protein